MQFANSRISDVKGKLIHATDVIHQLIELPRGDGDRRLRPRVSCLLGNSYPASSTKAIIVCRSMGHLMKPHRMMDVA